MSMVRMDPETLLKAAHHWLHFWGAGGYRPGSFTEKLMRCMSGADRTNLARLGLGFPEYMLIMQGGIGYAKDVIERDGVLWRPEVNFKDGSDGP